MKYNNILYIKIIIILFIMTYLYSLPNKIKFIENPNVIDKLYLVPKLLLPNIFWSKLPKEYYYKPFYDFYNSSNPGSSFYDYNESHKTAEFDEYGNLIIYKEKGGKDNFIIFYLNFQDNPYDDIKTELELPKYINFHYDLIFDNENSLVPYNDILEVIFHEYNYIEKSFVILFKINKVSARYDNKSFRFIISANNIMSVASTPIHVRSKIK